MKVTLEVTEVGGNAYQVTTTLPVLVAWERKFKRKASDLASGNIGLEDMVFWAYESAKRCNIPVPMTLDAYIEKIDNVEVVDHDAVVPTQAELTEDN
jgi:hypothetical protein